MLRPGMFEGFNNFARLGVVIMKALIPVLFVLGLVCPADSAPTARQVTALLQEGDGNADPKRQNVELLSDRLRKKDGQVPFRAGAEPPEGAGQTERWGRLVPRG